MHALRLLWAANNEDARQRRVNRRNRRCKVSNKSLSDSKFIQRFKINKQTFQSLCNELQQRTALKGTNEISLEIKILCTLSFLAKGSYQRTVGIGQHLTQRTASRCINEVIEALNHKNVVNKWIKFPMTKKERTDIHSEFQRKFGLPGTIGCIDCTHIAIVKPHQDDHFCLNNNGYYSLNVQMVCDSNLKILNVNAKFGGDTDDSYIFSTSKVLTEIENKHQLNEYVWLLGDSDYPLQQCLMTPIAGAKPESAEETYNNRHSKAINCIQLCIDMLKSRWKCLQRDRPLHYQPTVAAKIVIACCVLHNIALDSEAVPQIIHDNYSTVDLYENIIDEEVGEFMQGRMMLGRLIANLE